MVRLGSNFGPGHPQPSPPHFISKAAIRAAGGPAPLIHSGKHHQHPKIPGPSKVDDRFGKPHPHAKVTSPAKSSEPIPQLITDSDDRVTESGHFSARAVDALDDAGTESITISAKAPDVL